MDVLQVALRIRKIYEIRSDGEAAHELEDRLRRDVLVAIADGAAHAQEIAAEALKTSEIEFTRWYA